MSLSNIERLHQEHVLGTSYKAPVTITSALLCTLRNQVRKECKLESTRVQITTLALKHLYDKKPAEEYNFILAYAWKAVRFPDAIYKNKNGKRGSYVFAKKIKGNKYLCVLEVTLHPTSQVEMLYLATAFRLRKESYLNGYELFWSWKGGKSSS